MHKRKVYPLRYLRSPIDKIALVDAVKSAGGQPFLIFPQQLVLCVIPVRGVYDTAASGGLNVYDLMYIQQHNGAVYIDGQPANRQGAGWTVYIFPGRT